MARWWKPNRIFDLGLTLATLEGVFIGGLTAIRWGALAGVEWGFGAGLADVVATAIVAYAVWWRPAVPAGASVLEGADPNPLHPREGDSGGIPGQLPQEWNKCCWCGWHWSASSPPECPNCHTPSPRWRPEYGPNRAIGFGNEYSIQGFSVVDGRTIMELRWPGHRGSQPSLPVEDFLLAQIRAQAELTGLGLQDLTHLSARLGSR